MEATAGINSPPTELIAPGDIRSALDSTWHYIRYGDGREELFAWRTDTAVLTTVGGTPAGLVEAAGLRAIVERALAETASARSGTPVR
jgi:hypothetical protein